MASDIFVLLLLLANVTVIPIHMVLEGLIARFNVIAVPDIEKMDSVDGVSECHNDHSS